MNFLRDFKEKIGISRLDDMKKQDLFVLAIAGLVLAGAFGALVRIDPAADASAGGSVPAPAEKRTHDAFSGVKIQAKSAYVWDMKEGRALYELDSDRIMPLASVTKVMMAMTAIDLMPKYTVVRIDGSFLDEEGDSGLYADESWRLKDLLDYSLVVSSNDGASAVAAVAGSVAAGAAEFDMGRQEFIRRMNQKASKIGLSKTHFNNATGLDSSDYESGGYGTAKDAAKMFAHALKNYPDVLEATRYSRISVSSLDNIAHTGYNTNQNVNDIPGLVASKTGYTDLSGGNLVIVFDAGINRPVVISVLGSTYDGRFADARALAHAALQAIAAAPSEEPEITAAL